MERFHRVATRYLDNYLGWQRMLDALGKSATPHWRPSRRSRARLPTLNVDIALTNDI